MGVSSIKMVQKVQDLNSPHTKRKKNWIIFRNNHKQIQLKTLKT